MREPIVLVKTDLSEMYRIRPDTMSLTMNLETAHTSTLTMGIEGQSVPAVGDWLRIDTPQGESLVMRVKSVEHDVTRDTATVQLEHVINTLKDAILFGETKPADMGGSGGKATPTQAINYVLRGTDWTLGTCEYTEQQPYNFNNVSRYSALETICSAMEDYYWTYDTTAHPFVLNVMHRPASAGCEMRMSRNIKTLKMSEDRSQMFTRYYPVGNKNIKIGSVNGGVDYIEKNTDLYGVVEKTDTDSTCTTKEMLLASARAKINRHAEPVVTVTIDGLELSEATGEALDRLTLGKVCAVPIHQYATTITERVTTLAWRDVYADPEAVTVTLANNVRDIASIVAQLAKSGGGGASAQAKDEEEDHAWMVDATDHIALVAESIGGSDGQGGVDWSRVAQLIVDGRDMESKISMLVTETQGGLVVNTASIVAGINSQEGSYVRIRADKINLSGYVTVSQLDVVDAKILNLTTGFTTATRINARTLSSDYLIHGGTYYQPYAVKDVNGNTIYALAHS